MADKGSRAAAFLGFSAACRRFDVSPLTLRDRIRRGEIASFDDPLDKRRTLVRTADLARYARPRPADDRPVTKAADVVA